MNYSPIIKILTMQSSIKIYEIKAFISSAFFKNNLFNTKYSSYFILFFSVCMGHKINIKKINILIFVL